MKEELYVIKIGGNIIDDDEKLTVFLKSFAALNTPLQSLPHHKGGAGVKKNSRTWRGQTGYPPGRKIGSRATGC
ncbi:MAG TPA: hypothetical protein VIZ28_11185 [Chitinophagaceae bacterium]